VNLTELIDIIREDGAHEGVWPLGGDRQRDHSVPSLVVGLARFQSYRGRTEAALIQELEDYIEEAGIINLHFEVHDDAGVVQLW
jgi:hypothetical protein